MIEQCRSLVLHGCIAFEVLHADCLRGLTPDQLAESVHSDLASAAGRCAMPSFTLLADCACSKMRKPYAARCCFQSLLLLPLALITTANLTAPGHSAHISNTCLAGTCRIPPTKSRVSLMCTDMNGSLTAS